MLLLALLLACSNALADPLFVDATGEAGLARKTVNGGADKRFKKTGSGKFKRSQSHLNHILTKKSQKRKRHLRHSQIAEAADTPLIRRMLPYA